MSKGMQVAGGATVIALLLGWYAATNLEAGASFTYYQSLAEFQDSAAAREGRHARVHGYVADGSIERDVSRRRVVFSVQETPPHAARAAGTAGAVDAVDAVGAVGAVDGNGAATLPVVYASLETPDLFKDGAEVVVEGRLLGEGPDAHFRADKLLAKCPSKFEGRETAPVTGG